MELKGFQNDGLYLPEQTVVTETKDYRLPFYSFYEIELIVKMINELKNNLRNKLREKIHKVKKHYNKIWRLCRRTK